MPGNILADAVDFMRQNLVIPNHNTLGSTQADAGAKSMCLTPHAKRAHCNGRDTPIYILKTFRGQTDAIATFQAYWCPYAQNATLTCDLGPGASLCFTATMDGCSFGFAPGAAGTCRVAHSNEGAFGAKWGVKFADYGAAQDFQSMEQSKRIAHHLGEGASTITPSAYMYDSHGERLQKSTTFGVRTGGAWAFYTQTYAKVGSTLALRGVTHHP